MADINKVILVGNVGKDPEIRVTKEGARFAILSVATNEYFLDKITKEFTPSTSWHKVVVTNEKVVELVEKNVLKGSKVYVEGKMNYKRWTDNKGIERFSSDVVVPKYSGSVIHLCPKQEYKKEKDYTPQPVKNFEGEKIIDDDLPF